MPGHSRGKTDPDLRRLRIFAAVAESGGIARAQAELNLGSSTISAATQRGMKPTSVMGALLGELPRRRTEENAPARKRGR